MKKIMSVFLAVLLVLSFSIFALGSGESETENQGNDVATSSKEESNLGDYKVDIKDCRIAKDYEGKSVVIIKYLFTNNSEEPANFMFAFKDNAYQDGVGLNESYVLSDSAKYSSDNQTKDIKKGASLEVEVAYELNDTTTDVEVEVEELISFSDKKITKTFSIK